MAQDISNEIIEVGNKTLHTKVEQKLLRILIDEDLNFQGDTMLCI